MAFVRSISQAESGYSTTAVSTAQNHATGNAIVVLVSNYTSSSTTVSSIADTAGNTYVQAGSTWTGDGTHKAELWYALNITGNASNVVTVTFTDWAQFRAWSVAEYSGWLTTGAFDANGTGAVDGSTTTTHVTAAVTTSVADTELVGQFIAWDTAYSMSSSGTTTLRSQATGGNNGHGDRIVTSSGSHTLQIATASSTRVAHRASAFKLDVGGSDVTEALAGQAATASAGSVTTSRTVALSGSAVTASAGTLASTRSKALSGQAATASAGTVTQSRTKALSGSAVTASAGTITYAADSSVTVDLTGQAATASAGTVAPASTKALAGQAATASAGTLATTRSKALAGQAATASAGTVTPTRSKALAGSAATASAGTVTQSRTVALSGQAVTAAAGTIGVSLDGSVTLALSGAQITVAAGTLASARSKALSGSAATSAAGTLAPSTARSLTSVSVTSSAGAFSVSVSGALTGAQVQALAGVLTGDGVAVAVPREVVRLVSSITQAVSFDSPITRAVALQSAIDIEGTT